ncbi:formyltetrahydrofolate deformylase [Marinobacterium sedimentorum]|uniref:formyltetrahydrofolate deformylase n=1 Tax=Marinobacterium sedimentorum TaxID=2927804 RepID=UPI0020C681FC|nr:formyltetrahydrofolate deformylase [Marinobacterium sedimentorum]MCP8687208.1 formyltetrahydrofolate deformylase [Marinobacterium sedimentorum]
MNANEKTYILSGSSASKLGVLDLIIGCLYKHECYAYEIHTFDDDDVERFFFRVEFRYIGAGELAEESLRSQFGDRAAAFDAEWDLRDSSTPDKLVILVSKYDHCLQDILHRHSIGALNIEIPAIISNHPDLKRLAEWYHIPYYHLPITADTKPQQEAEMWDIIQKVDADLVVLARYMQVLSDDMCKKLHGRAINIHHSLLPGFKGAKPYHQAYDKGVKLVGATAHYVSKDLDEGPIITQGVEPVDHTYTPERLVAKGRDTERLALAKAIKLHVERRCFVNGKKTVVFPGH